MHGLLGEGEYYSILNLQAEGMLKGKRHLEKSFP